MRVPLAFASRWQRDGLRLLPLSVLALISLALTSCGGGQGTTRASGQPTASVSSNLGKVAYELDGSIYVKSLPDDEATRITEGTAPHWSPSGEWLLFSRDGDSWVVRADGSDEGLLSGNEAVWSPTEDRVAEYQGPIGRNPSTSLLVESADGSIRQEAWLLATPSSGPIWSPDGKRLAYSQEGAVPCSMAPNGGNGNPVRRSSLCVVNADNTQMPRIWPIDLYDSTTDASLVAGWTADGRYVLFWDDIQFSASLMADGTTLEAISAGGGEPRSLYRGLTRPGMVSPAASGAILAVVEGGGRETWTEKRIALVNVDSGSVTELTSTDMASLEPSWSPDGRSIAFVSQPDNREGLASGKIPELSRDRRIWVMNSGGTAQRPLTGNPAYRDERPLWSADGAQILFARLDEDMRASLWLMPSDGGEPRQIVDAFGPTADLDYYGAIDWGSLFDWWRPPTSEQATPDQTTDVTEVPTSASLRRTGIEGVDAVVDAVLSGDPEALRSFVRFTSIACTTNPLGLGGPPLCRPGEADGTLVDTFPIGTVEGYYLPADEIDDFLRSLTSYEISLYAVYLAPADSWLPGDYVALCSRDIRGTGVIGEELLISDGRLVGAKAIYQVPPEQVAQYERFGKVILPPP